MSVEIIVAIIGAVGIIGAAGFTFLGVVVSNLRKAVGTPNGQGDLVQMAERLLSGQAGQDKRLAKLESGRAEHASRITQVEQTLTSLTTLAD